MDTSYDLISLRTLVGDALNEAFETHPNIFVIDSDLAGSTTSDRFQERHPEYFVETGIAEQNAMSIATGIAKEGGIPFYVNFAIFATGTVWTQLRQACYPGANVKVLATHPGMDGGFDGATHHANEDLALTRVLPGLQVLVPANPDELREAVMYAAEHEGPVYIRCSRDVVPDLPSAAPLEVGRAVVDADEGDDFAIVYEGTSGDLARRSFAAAEERGARGVLVNVRSVKPLDVELIRSLAGRVRRIVTIENHSVIGGLGGAVAETLAEMGEHAPLARVGVEDVFTESGPSDRVKEKYGLCVENVLGKLGL